MSTRRKGLPRGRRPSDMYTMMDELLASPIEPMPSDDASTRFNVAELHLVQLVTAVEPTVMDWRVVAMVGNVMEVMLEQGVIQDPDGLLVDAFDALKAAAVRNITAGKPIRLSGPGLPKVRAMLRDWGEVMAQAPHRTMIRAFRETDRRMQRVAAGIRTDKDFVAQIDGMMVRVPTAT